MRRRFYSPGEKIHILFTLGKGRSLLGVLSLGIVKGTAVKLIADGADEEEAIETLSALIASDFSE